MAHPIPDDDIDDNSEQNEAGTQAQDVADSARARSTDLSEESEHGGHSNPAQIIPDDVPDLVDTMHAMNRSGRIDMDAYVGEPSMDDEDGAERAED
ncbi:hypothetical protein EBBID32_24760 [Sphingobium indicum BiD32]|uniref:Uncharacterized protein n=1 Tax=Sphingobium indicum BiD32 TaxID=1301087 RepID=N1MLP7_9SPHN|nr:hypothetical protein [Sphingobium indicum]CCW18125.1 hypothetical protein EBBID32_24760 [Sphingobium indicum BiD32]